MTTLTPRTGAASYTTSWDSLQPKRSRPLERLICRVRSNRPRPSTRIRRQLRFTGRLLSMFPKQLRFLELAER